MTSAEKKFSVRRRGEITVMREKTHEYHETAEAGINNMGGRHLKLKQNGVSSLQRLLRWMRVEGTDRMEMHDETSMVGDGVCSSRVQRVLKSCWS